MTNDQQIFLTVVLSVLAIISAVAAIITAIVVLDGEGDGVRLSWVPTILAGAVTVACLVALYFIVGVQPVPCPAPVGG